MKALPEKLAEQYADDKSKTYYIDENGEKKWYITPRGQYSKEDFLAGYKAAQQWISVKDRLPEEGQIALTICDNGTMFLLQKVSDEMFGVPIYWKYCCGFDKELGPNKSYCYDVTHWQPLPAPPKEEK